jgi:hypothetical protein
MIEVGSTVPPPPPPPDDGPSTCIVVSTICSPDESVSRIWISPSASQCIGTRPAWSQDSGLAKGCVSPKSA